MIFTVSMTSHTTEHRTKTWPHVPDIVMSLHPCLSSPWHFAGDSHTTLAPDTAGEDCRKPLPPLTGDLPQTGVTDVAAISNSLKFDARGVGCSEYASEEAYPEIWGLAEGYPNAISPPCPSGVLMEKMSALERFDGLGVIPIDEFDNADWSGAEEMDRRIRTWMWPLLSVSDSVRSGISWPSSEMTSPSRSILVMEAAVGPGNWVWIKWVAALYSNRNSNRVYLKEKW